MALLTVVDTPKKSSSSLTKVTLNLKNYGVCFQLYEKNFQHTILSKLKKEELKEFEKLIEEVVKCTKEDDFLRIYRGKNKKNKKGKLYNYEAHSELIHIGKARNTFRLHGVLIGKIFKIVSIDPKHQEHKC